MVAFFWSGRAEAAARDTGEMNSRHGGLYFDGRQRSRGGLWGWANDNSRGAGAEVHKLGWTSGRAACSGEGRGARCPGRGRDGVAVGVFGGWR